MKSFKALAITAILGVTAGAHAQEPTIDFGLIAESAETLGLNSAQLAQLQQIYSTTIFVSQALGHGGLNGLTASYLNLGYDQLNSVLSTTTGLTGLPNLNGITPASLMSSVSTYVGQQTGANVSISNFAGGSSANAISAMIPSALKASGLSSAMNIPGLSTVLAAAYANLGGLGGLQGYAPTYQGLTLPQGVTAPTGNNISYATAGQFTAQVFFINPGTATDADRKRANQARYQYSQASLSAALAIAPTLRSQIAAQPQQIEQIANDAQAASDLRTDMQANTKASIAILQAITRVETAATALLDLHASKELLASPASLTSTSTPPTSTTAN